MWKILCEAAPAETGQRLLEYGLKRGRMVKSRVAELGKMVETEDSRCFLNYRNNLIFRNSQIAMKNRNLPFHPFSSYATHKREVEQIGWIQVVSFADLNPQTAVGT